MCVFSPPLPPSLPCRFIPGPNGALFTTSALPPPAEQTKTITAAATDWITWDHRKDFHPDKKSFARVVPGIWNQTNPVWSMGPMLVTLLHHVAAPSFRPFLFLSLFLSVSLNWSLAEMTKQGQFMGWLKRYLIDIRSLRTVSGGLRPCQRNSLALEWDFLAQTGSPADERFLHKHWTFSARDP